MWLFIKTAVLYPETIAPVEFTEYTVVATT